MPSLTDFAVEALRLGRNVFVAATPEAPRDARSLEELRSTLRSLRGVGAVVGSQGFVPERGTSGPGGMDGSFAAAVLVASIAEPRTARDLGAELVERTRARIGVASTVDAPGAAPDELIAVALEGAKLAADTARPGGALVHTELYDLASGPLALALVERAPDADLVPRLTGLDPDAGTPVGAIAADPAAGLPATGLPAAGEDHSEPLAGESRAEDPFAQVSVDERDLTAELALTLTAGIAPPVAVLRTEERAQSALVAQLTVELEALRAEQEVRKRVEDPARLERRVEKLRGELQNAEDEIERLRTALESDPGVASAHRSVQGLGPDAPPAQQAALESIFRATQAILGAPRD